MYTFFITLNAPSYLEKGNLNIGATNLFTQAKKKKVKYEY